MQSVRFHISARWLASQASSVGKMLVGLLAVWLIAKVVGYAFGLQFPLAAMAVGAWATWYGRRQAGPCRN